MPKRDFLVEVGVEELPPKALAELGDAFANELAAALDAGGLSFQSAEPLFTPRRLAVIVSGLSDRQPDRSQQRFGPAVKAAFTPDGLPTRAVIGFAESCGVPVDALERVMDGKNERVSATVSTVGQATTALLPSYICGALDRLPIPKRMRWGDGEVTFLRPVRWVLMLFGTEIIEADILGVRSDKFTRGHRFHRPRPLRITSAKQYRRQLETRAFVRLNDRERSLSAWIREQVHAAAVSLNGEALGLDGGLPDEVASLCEWPVPIIGSFDSKYLSLPEEVLITTLEHHQRYFPVKTEKGLLPYFITFANIESKDLAVVQAGNERVVTPRLDDAMFFWNKDCETSLEQKAAALDTVSFQAGLGSLADKSVRITALAGELAGRLGLDGPTRDNAQRAAILSKGDLLSAMVGEFPELQGVMGRYYAEHDGEDSAVAIAVGEQYLPRFAGDALPRTAAGTVLALADRLDTLCGTFASNGKPTGDKDPFALRRTALGVLRILVEGDHPLDLLEAITIACARLPNDLQRAQLANEIFDFTMDRLRAWLSESGTEVDTFEAVLAVRPTSPLDFVARVRAVEDFRLLPEAATLAAANKRIGNILKQTDSGGGTVDDTLLNDAAEQELWGQLAACSRDCKPLLAEGRYTDALHKMAALRDAVDEFFEAVMVMHQDLAIRTNRVALLERLQQLFHKVAAIGLLQPRADQ